MRSTHGCPLLLIELHEDLWIPMAISIFLTITWHTACTDNLWARPKSMCFRARVWNLGSSLFGRIFERIRMPQKRGSTAILDLLDLAQYHCKRKLLFNKSANVVMAMHRSSTSLSLLQIMQWILISHRNTHNQPSAEIGVVRQPLRAFLFKRPHRLLRPVLKPFGKLTELDMRGNASGCFFNL